MPDAKDDLSYDDSCEVEFTIINQLIILQN